jgi:hypothetical protein
MPATSAPVMTLHRLQQFSAAWTAGPGPPRRGGIHQRRRRSRRVALLPEHPDGTGRLIRGCGIFEFASDKIRKKDAFRKVPDDI